MNRTMPVVVVALAIMTSGCVIRTAPRPVVVQPQAPPPVVVGQPPVVVQQPPVIVQQPPVIVQQPPVIVAPPQIVLVPGTQVYMVPSASFNVFVYAGRYYSHHHGTWFTAARHGVPWTAVPIDAVPAQVRAVPVKHYKLRPSHATPAQAVPTPAVTAPPSQAPTAPTVVYPSQGTTPIQVQPPATKPGHGNQPGAKPVKVKENKPETTTSVQVTAPPTTPAQPAPPQNPGQAKKNDKDDDKDDRCAPGQAKKGRC